MNLPKAVLLKLIAAFLFAVMSVLVRWLGEALSGRAGGVLPPASRGRAGGDLLCLAARADGGDRIGRPLGHVARGLTGVAAMFCIFAALARLPIADVTAITFATPLIIVALAASSWGSACASIAGRR